MLCITKETLDRPGNVALDGSDSFDRLVKICKTLENKSSHDLVKELTEGRRYLKCNYRAHCNINGCKDIADQCIRYALSDEKNLRTNQPVRKNMMIIITLFQVDKIKIQNVIQVTYTR